MAEYFLREALKLENETLARYYVAETVPAVTMAARPEGQALCEVRADLDPRVAARMGIDPTRTLTADEIARMLSGKRADGKEIEGKQIQAAMRSVAEIFGLDGRHPPKPAEIANVLQGLRGDGAAPHDATGALTATVIAGARKRFLAAYGVVPGGEATPDQLRHIAAGLTAGGRTPVEGDLMRKLAATKAPVTYLESVFSADKSVAIAWALAPTQAERSAIEGAHRTAVELTMRYAEEKLAFVRLGKAGSKGIEQGKLAWFSFQHYTARPVAEIRAVDTQGVAYTAFQEVPTGDRTSDMLLHSHVVTPNAVFTASGKVGSIDFDRLDGLTKEFGGVYQAFLGRELRAIGGAVAVDRETGAARLTSVSSAARTHFSRRGADTQEAARELASAAGLSWDTMTDEAKLTFLRRGVMASRNQKEKGDGASDFVRWRAEAKAIGYHHRSILRPGAIMPERARDDRLELAYEIANVFIERLLADRARLDASALREAAVRGLVEAGISDRPGDDINALTHAFRTRGVQQDGERVALIWGRDAMVRGRERMSVTTSRHVDAERVVSDLTKGFAADPSAALPRATIERATQDFLARRPDIDTSGAQWQAQQPIIDQLGTAARFGVVIGVGGAGKTTMLEPVVAAMHAHGRTTYGVANSWKHATPLAATGIEAGHCASIAAFLKRIETGKYNPGRDSTVFIDELSRVGRGEMLGLLRAQEQRGFQVLAIGDPKQCGSIDAPVMDLLLDALGDKVPSILISARQRTQRERDITSLFRSGHAEEAIAMKREDGTAVAVAGGRQAAIDQVAALWRDRIDARGEEPDYKLTISAPTNADARDISAAVRVQMRDSGRLGPDQIALAVAVRGEAYTLMLAAGDKVRVYDRIHAATREIFASNGNTIDVVEASKTGMRARNEAGREIFVPWSKISGDDGRVRLSYAYAGTTEAAMGGTSSEHIDAPVSGSVHVGLQRGHTAEGRQRDTTYLVINEAAERRQIAAGIRLGEHRAISREDIWRNVAGNYNRDTNKGTATDFLRRATGLQRGSIAGLQAGSEPLERRQAAGQRWTMLRRMQSMRLDVVAVRDFVQRTAQNLWAQTMQRAGDVALQQHQAQRQGPRMRM